tara:strand:- start:1019 stop:1216 length:198 start_codon:yes stop_codon:yes gene_type:complete
MGLYKKELETWNMKKETEWNHLTNHEQSEYLARAEFLLKKGYSQHGLSVEELAKQIFEKSPGPQG